jgi:hypothetical protein
MKSPFLPSKFVLAIALSIVSPWYSSTFAQALEPVQPFDSRSIRDRDENSTLLTTTIVANRPPDLGRPPGRTRGGGTHYVPPKPPKSGAPGGRPRGGAGRGNCPKVAVPLTILIPNEQVAPSPDNPKSVTSVWGQSASEKPTFWFFVPYDDRAGFSAEFALQDAAGNDIHRAPVALPSQPGIVAVPLPESIAPLTVDALYQIYFTVKCGSTRMAQSEYVKGWVQHIALDPDLAEQIAAASPEARPAIYASHSLWFDALTAIAHLRLKDPNNSTLQLDWQQLLKSANLGDITNQPPVRSQK